MVELSKTACLMGGVEITSHRYCSQGTGCFTIRKWIEPDGKLLDEDFAYFINDNQQLHIEEVDERHVGRYSCVAENIPGRVEKDMLISLLKPPVMLEQTKSVEVQENETITLTCPVESTDESTQFEWSKHGMPVTQSSNLQMSSSGKLLHIMRSQTSDSGSYVCVASNEAGEDDATFDLFVLVPPSIKGPSFHQMESILNHTVQLQCVTNAIPEPDIEWFRDGQKIFSGLNAIDILKNGSVLRIIGIQTEHEGRYTCVATNKVGRAEADTFVQVIEKPRIETPSPELRVVEGRQQRLECTVMGIPPPKVEWWRNGEPMEKQKHHFSSSGNTHWIHFRNVQLSDAGRYTCIATNQGGETRQNIALNVLVPPSIADGERIMRVAEAGQLALDCVTKGHPTPEIVWKKEGIIVNATLKTRLLIVNITSDDNGRYTCEAKNEAGLATVDYVVEVLIKPRMKVHVADLRVIEGERAKLECEADGYPEPSIKWMRGGRPITDMANFILSPGGETLMILKTKRSDGGVYSCVVTNSAGEIEAPFTVTVLTAPHIEQTIDQNPRVINNNSVALDCPVLGYPEPEVIWLKDNEPVTYDLNFVKDGKNNLKIHRIAVSNKGRYTCQAKNEVGSLNTDYQLEVLAPPKFGAEGQRIFEVVEGEPATVICPVEAVPLPNIEWLRGINPIHGSDNVRISSDAKKVTIMRTTLHDGGKYTCKATNIAGSTDIDLILKVLVPPHIDKSNLINNPLGIFGKEIFLECPASGIPQPTIIWTRDGIPINFENSEEGKYSLLQGNQSFSIAKIDASDQGRYTCEVHNKGGRTSEQFSVEVLVPPQMEETEQQKLTKREGDALTLICPIKGEMLESNSELRVTWAKDGRPLESIGSPNYEITNDGRRLQLIGSSISDAGQYKCVASNRAGEAHVKFNVDILSKPVIDGSRNEPKPHIILGHPITLWCPASGNPLPKIRWYRNGIEIGQQPNHQNYRILDQGQGIEISKSADEDDGIWTCEAENAAGTSQLEIPLDVWVEPTVKVHALDNNPIKPVGSSITLFCNVSGNPTPVITWMLNDQILIPSADGTRISLSGYRLDIPRLQTEDAGDYYCIAQNEVGNTKDAIAVDILVPPLIDRDTVELNPHLPLGRTLTLFCDAKGEPTPILSWYINDTLIEDSASNNYRQNVVFGENHKFIQVPNVSLSNKGVYRCEATNSAGTDELVYKVDIFQSPTIYKGGTEQVTEGKVAILECNASGEPPPLVTWQRNGVRVETGLRYVVDDRVLKIIDTRSSDSGIYVCVATNEAGTDQQAFTLEVLIAPKLVSTSANSTVALNGNTSLRCAARGYPIPKVLWSVDDDQKPINEALVEGVEYVTDDNGAVLHLMNLKHRGNRMFNCAVVNDAGMDEIMYSVRTIAPPLITKDGVKVQNVTESETVKITCDVGHKENDYSSAGADEDETTWQKDGTTFEPDHSIQISLDQKELTFFTVQLHHAGNYSCTVKNFAGVASQYIQLNVGVPPKVSENSRKVIVKRGELAELWCEAVGIPPPKISWFKDNISLLNSDVASEGDIVSGEMKRTAFFSDISPDKAGVYTCKAENWAGVDYMTVDLVVLIPPEIIPDKLNISVNLGETIVLPCNASGIPEPVVSWVKAPHMEIFGNEDKYQILGTSLAIKKVAVSDDGFYRCIAKSEAGQAIGLRRIDTNFPTKGFKKYWVECDENGVPVKSTTFVPARGDIPQDTENYFHWDTEYMQHQEMPENGTDGRFYACLPSHRNGRGPRRVPINTLPHFVETPLNTVVNLGAELRLHCSAMGSPTPAIFWLKNGHLLDEFRSMDGSSVLHLRAHNSSIIGEYVCVARNLIGESRAVATVRIGHEETKSQPVLRSAIKPSKDLSASKPVTVLNCFNGTMAAQNRVIWRNKGRRISQMDEIMHSMNNGSLVLHYFASDEELSHFDCKIHDITGQVQHTGELEVMEVVPRALIRPTRIYTHPMRDIIIDCKLKTGNPLTTRVQWSKNNVNLESDFDKFEIMPNNSLIIRSVMDPDRGSYKCRSWNSHGKSWDDVDLIIEDLPESVVGRLSGSINGHEIQETHANMVLADMEPQLGSNDILMQIDDLPKNVAKSGSKATKTIISIMKAPITQLGYDPDGPEPLPTGHKHRPKSFERLTHYSFQSGEKMRVKQQNRKDESSDGSMPVDVNFDGDVPNIDEDEFTIDPLEEDLVEESPGKITGYGKSAVNFGKNRRVAFKWEDQITYDSSANDSTPNQQIEAGSTMHIQARANLENDSKALRLQVKVDRFGSCPEGYSKIRDICRDVNECTMVDGICASEAECRNTFGGFECQRVCAKGYQASADGECIDIDECSMGMDECDPTTECLNTEGSYECIESCADGFYHNTENICEDINECQLDDPCTMPMFCENLLGSYKCLCPAGFPLINDTCQGISMDPMKPLKLFEYSAEPEEGNCPSGFTWNGRESLCADVDECAFDAPCQYECSNKAGAFECSCPDGYVLNESGQCTDINECDIDGICEEGELCFNQLGTHSCMRSPCPHRYRLDYKKAQCVPLCRNCTEIPINLHMLAVPRAMSAGSPLIRLSAYDAAGRPLRHTNFEIQEERKYVNGYFAAPLPFYLRTVHGRATLHNQNRLLAGSLHKIPIRSSSKEGGIGHAHKYQTNYLIFVAVSKYPF